MSVRLDAASMYEPSGAARARRAVAACDPQTGADGAAAVEAKSAAPALDGKGALIDTYA